MMHPFRKLRKTVHDIQLFLVSRDRDLLSRDLVSRDRDLLSRDRDFTFGPVRELWPNRTNRNDN